MELALPWRVRRLLEADRCPVCGYPRAPGCSSVCSECGVERSVEVKRIKHKRRRGAVGVVLLGIGLIVIAVVAGFEMRLPTAW
jgi:predicted nucleic acid-binding Zn ribbon protein